MKTASTRTASSNLPGALLLLSLFSAAMMSFNPDGLTDLYNVCQNQWHDFVQNLTQIQPHRTAFPN